MKEFFQNSNTIAALISLITALSVLTVDKLTTARNKSQEADDKEHKFNIYFKNYLRICRSNFIAIDHIAFTFQEENLKNIDNDYIEPINKYNNNSQMAISKLVEIDPSYISKENMEMITVIIQGMDLVEDIFYTSLNVLKRGDHDIFFEVITDLSEAASDMEKKIDQFSSKE